MGQRSSRSKKNVHDLALSEDPFHRFLFYTYRAQNDHFDYGNDSNTLKMRNGAPVWVNLRKMLSNGLLDGSYDVAVEEYLHTFIGKQGRVRDEFVNTLGVNFRSYTHKREVEISRELDVYSLLQYDMSSLLPKVNKRAPATMTVPPAPLFPAQLGVTMEVVPGGNVVPAEPAAMLVEAPPQLDQQMLPTEVPVHPEVLAQVNPAVPLTTVQTFDAQFPNPIERYMRVLSEYIRQRRNSAAQMTNMRRSKHKYFATMQLLTC